MNLIFENDKYWKPFICSASTDSAFSLMREKYIKYDNEIYALKSDCICLRDDLYVLVIEWSTTT